MTPKWEIFGIWIVIITETFKVLDSALRSNSHCCCIISSLITLDLTNCNALCTWGCIINTCIDRNSQSWLTQLSMMINIFEVIIVHRCPPKLSSYIITPFLYAVLLSPINEIWIQIVPANIAMNTIKITIASLSSFP